MAAPRGRGDGADEDKGEDKGDGAVGAVGGGEEQQCAGREGGHDGVGRGDTLLYITHGTGRVGGGFAAALRSAAALLRYGGVVVLAHERRDAARRAAKAGVTRAERRDPNRAAAPAPVAAPAGRAP
eukprot:gene34261-12212_t